MIQKDFHKYFLIILTLLIMLQLLIILLFIRKNFISLQEINHTAMKKKILAIINI